MADNFHGNAASMAYTWRGKLERLPAHYLDTIAQAVVAHRAVQRRCKQRHDQRQKAAKP